MKSYANFIDGDWRPALSGQTLPMINPSLNRSFAEIAMSGVEDVDRAVKAARNAFETGPWSRMTATERGRCLTRLAALIEAKVDELALLEAQDTGKPMRSARSDILAAARYFEFYGAAADKLHGEVIPYLEGYFVAVLKEPYGVTGHILPWNYPAQMFGRTIAPALAVGNATVLKPAEDACVSILAMVELAAQAGFPPGVLNVVTGIGSVVGAALAGHPDVNFVSFTGSPDVGRLIQRAAADHYAGCVLELGGKSPQIVFADADLDAALPVVQRAIVANAGQTCSAGSRVLVERGIYDDFVGRLADGFRTARAGSPDMDLDCGPVISAKQKKRVETFLEQAKVDGVPLLAEGSIAEGVSQDGFFVKPSLFGPVPRSNTIAREEVFGPVLVALPFDDEADAIRLSNATEYGLAAGIWSQSGPRQMRVAKRLKCGSVFINGYGAGAGVELPFGGVKKSGHGREKGFAALDEFCATKTVSFYHG